MAIPKILHFTWKTDDVPGLMGLFLDKWNQMHPGWDVRLWTDASMRVFVAEEYPEFLATYDGYPKPIQRADSFRYLVLNRLGGVYSDLDVEPLRPIDDLVAGLTCFCGVEPDEHMGSDRRHSGVPFLVSNAFMGAEPVHPYFKAIVNLLPEVADNPEVFLSTGPSLTTGVGVRLPREDRPVLLPPCLWSPLCDGGQKCTTDDAVFVLAGPGFDFAWADREAFVSHVWMTSWVPWYKRHKWLATPFHAMHAAKWRSREVRHPELMAVDIADPLFAYLDQVPTPLPDPLPKVVLCTSGALADAALSGLGYPAERIETLSGDDGAAGRNALIEQVLKTDAAWALFVGPKVTQVPAHVLTTMLEADKPVVALAGVDAQGEVRDRSVFRYRWGGGIRVVYKIRGEDGVASADQGQRDYLPGLKAFAQVPLDGVGTSCVLVRRDVLEAGVRFAETPYHLHLDGEGFALMARHRGFEVAGLTEASVTVAS